MCIVKNYNRNSPMILRYMLLTIRHFVPEFNRCAPHLPARAVHRCEASLKKQHRQQQHSSSRVWQVLWSAGTCCHASSAAKAAWRVLQHVCRRPMLAGALLLRLPEAAKAEEEKQCGCHLCWRLGQPVAVLAGASADAKLAIPAASQTGRQRHKHQLSVSYSKGT